MDRAIPIVPVPGLDEDVEGEGNLRQTIITRWIRASYPQ